MAMATRIRRMMIDIYTPGAEAASTSNALELPLERVRQLHEELPVERREPVEIR